MSRDTNQQNPADLATTPLKIQQDLTILRRELRQNDFDFQVLLLERNSIQAKILEKSELYRDALGADRLREQGAAAVEAAMEICEVEL